MSEFKKYALRFGLVLLITVPIIFFAMGENAVKTMLYKVCLVVIAWGLAELVWIVGYKFIFGKAEDMQGDAQQAVLIFRGILFGAIILALTLGL